MKAVIFDFDGTLTKSNINLWKKIWKDLGYDVGPNSYYKQLLQEFLDGKRNLHDWCNLIAVAFQEKGLTKQKLIDIIKDVVLLDGVKELIEYLYSKNIEIHIVSGNIDFVINYVLGDSVKYITQLNANEFVFDKDDKLAAINSTSYDHEGKALYIKELCKNKGFVPSDILFIGNSFNDEWAYTSGAKTLCVNPDRANSENPKIWNKVVYTDNLLTLKDEI